MQDFKNKTILSTFSGKIGCMCGCQGKHNYLTTTREEAGKDRGYAIRDEEISDRGAAIIAKKVLNNPTAKFDEKANCLYVEDDVNNKMQVIYFA